MDPESRRIVPTDAEKQGRTVVKMVYVVLEAQYQVSCRAAKVVIGGAQCKLLKFRPVDTAAQFLRSPWQSLTACCSIQRSKQGTAGTHTNSL